MNFLLEIIVHVCRSVQKLHHQCEKGDEVLKACTRWRRLEMSASIDNIGNNRVEKGKSLLLWSDRRDVIHEIGEVCREGGVLDIIEKKKR